MPDYSPKLDWTAADVLNFEDFVRIDGGMQALGDYVEALTAVAAPLHENALTSTEAIPSTAEINKLERNLDALVWAAGFCPNVYDTKQWGPGNDRPDYSDANRWERDLVLLRELLDALAKIFRRCGTASCGGPALYIRN